MNKMNKVLLCAKTRVKFQYTVLSERTVTKGCTLWIYLCEMQRLEKVDLLCKEQELWGNRRVSNQIFYLIFDNFIQYVWIKLNALTQLLSYPTPLLCSSNSLSSFSLFLLFKPIVPNLCYFSSLGSLTFQ